MGKQENLGGECPEGAVALIPNRMAGSRSRCLPDQALLQGNEVFPTLRDHGYVITDYRYGRKWDISCGSPRATSPPKEADSDKTLPQESEHPPVQKIPAKIEFPPNSGFRRILFAWM